MLMSKTSMCDHDRPSPSEDEAPILKLMGGAYLNDKGAADMPTECHHDLALRTLETAYESLQSISPHDRLSIEQKSGSNTFEKMFQSQGRFPSLLALDFLHDDDHPDQKLFASSMRVCHSKLPAKVETLLAVVSFNLGLLRHSQALRSSAERGPALLCLARRHYLQAVSEGSPSLVRAAAYCNLAECAADKDTAKLFRDQLDAALVDLEDLHHKALFRHLILLPAASA